MTSALLLAPLVDGLDDPRVNDGDAVSSGRVVAALVANGCRATVAEHGSHPQPPAAVWAIEGDGRLRPTTLVLKPRNVIGAERSVGAEELVKVVDGL